MICPHCDVLVAIGTGPSIAEAYAGVDEAEANDKFKSHMLYYHPTPEEIIEAQYELTDLTLEVRWDCVYGRTEAGSKHLSELALVALRLKSYIDKGLVSVLD